MTMSNAGVTFSVSVKEIELQRLDGSKVQVAFLFPDFQPQAQTQTTVKGEVHLNNVVAISPVSTISGSAEASNSTPQSGPTCRPDTFKCYNCPKTFGTHYMLKRHQQIHNGGAFPCLEIGCGTAFRNQTTLTKHLIVSHGLQIRAPRRLVKKEVAVIKRPQSPTVRGRQIVKTEVPVIKTPNVRGRPKGKKTGKKSKRMVTPSPETSEDEEDDEDDNENDSREECDICKKADDKAAATGMEMQSTSTSTSSSSFSGGCKESKSSSSCEIAMGESESTVGNGSGLSSEGLRFAPLEEASEQVCPSSPSPLWLLGMVDNFPQPEPQPLSSALETEEQWNLNLNDFTGLDLETAGWSFIFPDVIFEDLM